MKALRGQLHQGIHEAEDQDAEQHGEDAPKGIAPLGGFTTIAHEGGSDRKGRGPELSGNGPPVNGAIAQGCHADALEWASRPS
jgi:hypothetical protein